MNIYLCSTVRHLLFSLLKGLSEPENKNIIFMISDQQNIEPANFDCSILPSHIEVIFIARKQLRQELYSGLKGKVIKLMANFNVMTSPAVREKMAALLFNRTLHLSLSKEQLKSAKLFLFNDRNKMSRLFRLAFKQYTLMEEGLANYSGKKLKPLEILGDLITFNHRTMRYFGDNNRCQNIYLVNTEQVPNALQHKVKQINFIDEIAINQYCKPFFKVPVNSNISCILATQPLVSTGIDLDIYKKIIAACNVNNMAVTIKPHPSEDISRYVSAFPNTPLIDSKLPLELVVFGNQQKCNILSIYSTAGVGFEKYCNRINLIKDNEIEKVSILFNTWQADLSLVDSRVDKLFTEMTQQLI
ncbi:MAG: hypothetical protein ACI9T7_000191 [Oleiphilaceae bacterium]|jgi:hypothetical protein